MDRARQHVKRIVLVSNASTIHIQLDIRNDQLDLKFDTYTLSSKN